MSDTRIYESDSDSTRSDSDMEAATGTTPSPSGRDERLRRPRQAECSFISTRDLGRALPLVKPARTPAGSRQTSITTATPPSQPSSATSTPSPWPGRSDFTFRSPKTLCRQQQPRQQEAPDLYALFSHCEAFRLAEQGAQESIASYASRLDRQMDALLAALQAHPDATRAMLLLSRLSADAKGAMLSQPQLPSTRAELVTRAQRIEDVERRWKPQWRAQGPSGPGSGAASPWPESRAGF